MADMEKIVDRIKKLLAVANNEGATEAERDTAMGMAQRMMAKYNLDQSDLPSEEQEPRTLEEMVMSGDAWMRALQKNIGSLFFTRAYFMRGQVSGRDRYCFAGKASNVVTAMYMFEYIAKGIKREATKRYGSPTKPAGRSFCVGAMETVCARIRKMLQDAAVDGEGVGTSLVLRSLYEREDDANLDYLKDHGINLKQSSLRRSSIDANGYYNGRDHGQNISLNRQVGGKATNGVKLIGG